MTKNIRTLIAVAIIERASASLPTVAKRAWRVREDVAALADVFIVFNTDGVVQGASALRHALVEGPGFCSFVPTSTTAAPALGGLDFSGIIGTSPNPVRLLELDVDGNGRLIAADFLSAETIAAAKSGLAPVKVPTTTPEPVPTAGRILCGHPAFYGPCRLPVSKKGQLCSMHAGHLCGAEAVSTGKPCCNQVAASGDHCLLHGGPAKKARGRKAA